MQKVLTTLACCLLMVNAACADGTESCAGFTVTGTATQSSYSVPQLMAQAKAMGMTQQEAETLIYLEGISASTRIEPGETICIDGKPG